MVEREENMLPGDHEDLNKLPESDGNSSDSGNSKEEKESEFMNQFQFKNDQKVYWSIEQERAVEDYLKMSEVWLKNKIKWEVEESEEKGEEPNWEFILELEDLIEQSKDPEVEYIREKLFREKIDKPLSKLVENIVFSYKLFRKDVDVKSLQWDCLGFLMEKFANFKPSKGKKSFSYYGTVVKHYLIGEKRTNDDSQKENLEFESFKEEVNNIKKYELGDADPLEESSRLFNYIINEIKRELTNTNMSDNDKNVGNAIVNIFETHEAVQIYTKNNLYQMIKEYTDLQTKDITYSLSRFKTLYKITKQNFIKKNE